MLKHSAVIGALAVATMSAPAWAQSTRTAVSPTGSDSGICSVPAPCRTIAYALTQTASGGEMIVLGSAGYGTFTVTQAVTINAPPGTQAFVSSPSGDAVTINAGPSDLVILTGFFLDGFGTGGSGVQVNTVGSFSLGGSTVAGFTGHGINYTNSAASGTNNLTVTGSAFYSDADGIMVRPSGGTTHVNLSNSTFSGATVTADNNAGAASVSALIDNCTIRYNGGSGVVANGAFVQIHRSALAFLNNAMVASGTGSIDLNLSSVSNVTTLATGTVRSYGNNGIAGPNPTAGLTAIATH